MANKIEVKNKRASFEYHLLDTYECGLVLMGSEIKSIRANGATIGEAFCAFVGGDLLVRGMQINPYGSKPAIAHATPESQVLQAYPNPTNGAQWIACLLPEEAATAIISVRDVLGRELLRTNAIGGIVELPASEWGSGIYTATLLVDGINAGAIKLVIQR